MNHKDKGWVSLTKSGSGIKTILFVIVLLKIIPIYQGAHINKCCFLFEELENNLHPYTIRRLYSYIFNNIQKNESLAFFTTHSSVVLDLFSTITDASVTRVISTGSSAYTQSLNNNLDVKNILDDLGSKASDLMLSNGIIWVEGPSDRVYINKWIEIYSNEHGNEILSEGRHYTVAFYGGANLKSIEYPGDSIPDPNKVNAETINRNFFVICDRDDAVTTGELKKRVDNIKKQLEGSGRSHLIWITEAREIENYITVESIKEAKLSKVPVSKPPSANDVVFSTSNKETYSHKHKFASKGSNKVLFAKQVSQFMKYEDMILRHDWNEQMAYLFRTINKWNS